MIKADLRRTFNSNAELYNKIRPNYPDDLFSKLVAETGLDSQSNLLEIGPGTGQATKPLAKRGFRITAIELGPELAEKAKRELSLYSNVDIITGGFEDIELESESYDLVYSATAFHWIKPEFKFNKTHRILKPKGYLAIIHTEHIGGNGSDKFFSASQNIYRKYKSNYQPNFKLPKLNDLKPTKDLDEKLFCMQSFNTFPLTIKYSSEEYADLLATYSPNIAMAQEDRRNFLEEIRALIDDEFGGSIDKNYAMTLTIARKI